MARTKPLSQVLDLRTYEDDVKVLLRLLPDTESEHPNVPDSVEVPRAIVRRLHHLGRAFDGQAVKFLNPQGRVRVEHLWLQRLIGELELVGRVTTDSVALHYLSKLIPMLKASSSIKNCALLIIEP